MVEKDCKITLEGQKSPVHSLRVIDYMASRSWRKDFCDINVQTVSYSDRAILSHDYRYYS